MVVKADDGVDLRKQEDEDEVEEHENLEVPHDGIEHRNDVTYWVKDSQEEECLMDLHQEDESHHQLAWKRLWTHRLLQNDVRDATPDIDHVKVVSKFTEVIS